MPADYALNNIELALRFTLLALAIWAALSFVRNTLRTAHARSEAIVHATAPDATPYGLLPNAEQRIEATKKWAAAQTDRITWVWDAQIARTLALAAVLAGLAALGVGLWLVPLWGAVGLASLALFYQAYQLRDQRARALRALAGRRDELIRNIQTPG